MDGSSSDAEAGAPQPALLVDEWLKLQVPEGRPSQLAVLHCRLAAAFAFKVCSSGDARRVHRTRCWLHSLLHRDLDAMTAHVSCTQWASLGYVVSKHPAVLRDQGTYTGCDVQVERPTMALPAPLTDALQSIQTMLSTEGGLCSTTRPPPRCDTPAMLDSH